MILALDRVIELNLRVLKTHHGVTVELAHKLDVGRIRLRRADGWHTSRGFGCGSDGREGCVSQVGQAVDTAGSGCSLRVRVAASYWPMYVRGESVPAFACWGQRRDRVLCGLERR